MANFKRLRKQIFIGLIIIFIITSISAGLYYLIRPVPSCFDNKKNQNEEGIDCGGPCLKPCIIVPYPQLLIKTTKAISVGQEGYDVVAEIQNQNPNFGAQYFDYSFKITDEIGIIKEFIGNSFILPGDNKYLIKRKIDFNGEVIRIDLDIKNIKWVEFINPDLPEFFIYNKKFEIINQAGKYAQASGIVYNKNNWGFDALEVTTMLLDKNKNIVGVGMTNLYTVDSEAKREFYVTWPTKFLNNPDEMIIKIQTNIFLNDNYMQIYAKQEKFQELEK